MLVLDSSKAQVAKMMQNIPVILRIVDNRDKVDMVKMAALQWRTISLILDLLPCTICSTSSSFTPPFVTQGWHP